MIKLNNIVVRFGDFTALHDINVHVKEGEFFTFLGPSGCGKTTTLRTITGFIDPVEGSVHVKDRDITHVPIEDRNIGIVFQSYALFPTMTVYDNIAFGLKVKKLKKAEVDKKVREIAKKVDLSDEQLKKAVSQLSGGQQQRVAIARALVTSPAIICMDEPLSNLDARLRLQTREEIRRIQKETGITTIFVTHDQEEAMSISDMIVVMKLGVVQQIGAPQDVYDDPTNLFVAKFLGTPPINVFAGEVKGGKLYLGEEAVLDVAGVEDRKVTVGIRPEGFIPCEDGALTCNLSNVEVMGRDVSVVSTHAASLNPQIRSIVDADNKIADAATIRFNLKPHKVFLFDAETEVRIRF